MPVYVPLCKIADKATETDFTIKKSRCFMIQNTVWKVIEGLDETNISPILRYLRECGFKIMESEDKETLFAAYEIGQIPRGYEKQAALFPLLFKNYRLSEDIGVRVNLTELNQIHIKTNVTQKFYDALFSVHQKRQSSKIEAHINLPDYFLPELSCYQKRAVKWLLQRERNSGKIGSFFKRLEARDGRTCVYKNSFTTEFYDEPPADIILPPGGILADEMGLGKTVELLALIILHKWPVQSYTMPELNNPADVVDKKDVSPPKKRRNAPNLHCLCGASTDRGDLIQCRKCQLWQHARCVNKDDSNHASDINAPYLCPGCWQNLTNIGLIPSGATLIVTPSTIRRQWLQEIKRHISSNLRVYNYEGVSNNSWISPRQLADYDIVLTDYSILKREVYFTEAQKTGRVLRHKRRYMRTYTPLLMIKWWRCCLDEAQMIESDVSQMVALVHSIPAINRWAVTGTPIQRSIDDLHSLVHYIGLKDFLNSKAWDTLVKDFMQHCDDKTHDLSSLPLIEILGNIMWRTGKEQVKDELPIPPQTERVHVIKLSDLERLYYTEQHKECKEDFEKNLSNYFQSLDQCVFKTSQHLLNNIMKPLLKIRMCCTIPTVIAPRNQQVLTGVAQKQFLQPKELHAHLLTRNEKECKGHLRSIASGLNGLAALHFIESQYLKAVDNYEAVLKLASKYSSEKNISVDSLLQIHALFNILQARNLSPDLELKRSKEIFEEYESQLNELEWKYLETYASQLCRVNQNFNKARNTLHSNMEKTEMDLMIFLGTLLMIDDNNTGSQLLAKILEECKRKFGGMRLEAASSLRGVLYMINTWFQKLKKIEKNIMKAFDELIFFTSNIKPRSQVSVQTWRDISSFLNSVCDCHLIELRELENEQDNESNETMHKISRTRQRNGKNACKLCKLINMINTYECLLFKKSIDLDTNVVEGDENPQLELEMIKIIFHFLKPKCPTMAVEMENHFSSLQSMQNFCKIAIKFWIEIEFTAKAFDELDMCKMRITLTEDAAERNNYKILQHEVNFHFARQTQYLKHSQHCFDLKYARLKYIKYLEADSEVGSCPICCSDEEKRHAFLVCGHQICWACFRFLTKTSHLTRITCPLCRAEQPTESVYFMNSSNNVGRQNQGDDVRGDYSAKLTYIVRLVKQLIREHKSNNPSKDSQNENYPLKILIFSQWTFVLNSLGSALSENGITFVHCNYVRHIELFRNPDSGITCLLMPLSKGCKGLNLVEATHVFLIEPVLNPSEELQAVGRVHRRGQIRPTTVHRFIVEDTVEENIRELVSAGGSISRNELINNITFENLRNLFTQERN